MHPLPADVEPLIPHGKSIRLVDRLITVQPDASRTDYLVHRNSPLVDDAGKLDELAYIEMIAQSAAAARGFQLTAEQRRDHIGMLLGVRDLTISDKAHIGNQLTIDVHVTTTFADFAIVEGQVRHIDGRLIAAAELKIWSGSKSQLPHTSDKP